MGVLSFKYLLFLLTSFIVYWIIPDKIKKHFILILSFLFCLSYGYEKALFVFLYTLLIYVFTFFVRNRSVFVISVAASLMPLFFSKYYTPLISFFGVGLPDLHLSIIGISFLCFRAISYLSECRKGTIVKNDICDYLLYMLFFPCFLSGPIERADSFIAEITKEKKIFWNVFVEALIFILFGFLMKIVFADRIVGIINAIYAGYEKYTKYSLIAILAYPLYIYCDFAGYSYIAYGSAKLFGYEIHRNFRQPYFSRTIKEFWNRWHMSLNLWFRDYLYIPLGGNRKGKLRKFINLMIVFLLSGIWHGAGIGYIIWGLLNGLYQVIGELTAAHRNRIYAKMKLENSLLRKTINIIVTFLLISFSWIFFSQGLKTFAILAAVFEPRKMSIMDFMLSVCAEAGSSRIEIMIIIVAATVIFACDFAENCGLKLPETIAKDNVIVRYAAVLFLIMFVLVFGKYGGGYNPDNFIYFGF